MLEVQEEPKLEEERVLCPMEEVSIEEASWILEDNTIDKDQLQEELDEDNPQKVDDVE